MPPNALEVALGALQLAAALIVSLFLPILIQILLLLVAGWALNALAWRASAFVALLLSLIGTPVHEFSHAIGFLITLTGVAAIKPVFDGLGYAFVISRRRYCWGALVSSIAPLFGAAAVLWLTASYVIPGFQVTPVAYAELDVESAGWGNTLAAAMNYVELVLQNAVAHLSTLQWTNWRTYLGLYVALSVAIGLAPSDVDWRLFFGALPLALLLCLGIFAWLYISGDAAGQFVSLRDALLPHLITFSTVLTYALVLTLLGAFLFFPLGVVAGVRRKAR